MANPTIEQTIGLLEEMKGGKQVSVQDTLSGLRALRDDFDSLGDRLLDHTDDDSFYFYDGTRRSKLILDQIVAILGDIRNGFKGPEIKYPHIKIAKDPLGVIYIMKKIFMIAQKVSSKKQAKITDSNINTINDLRIKLRITTRDHDVLEPMEVHKPIDTNLELECLSMMAKQLKVDQDIFPELKNA